jgi:hypothetical protein
MAKVFRTETLSLSDNIRLASSGAGAFEIQNAGGSTLMSKESIESDISSLQAGVTAEAGTRGDKDTGLDSDVSSLQAAVTAEAGTRGDKDTGLDSDVSSLQAAVTAEAGTRGDKDTSIDSDISSLVAKDGSVDSDVSSLQAAVTAEAGTRGDKDTGLDSDVSSLHAAIVSNDVVAISSSVTNGSDNSGSIAFGRTFTSTPVVVAQLKSSDANDPIIACMISTVSTTNATVTFADSVPSSNYTVELIASIAG